MGQQEDFVSSLLMFFLIKHRKFWFKHIGEDKNLFNVGHLLTGQKLELIPSEGEKNPNFISYLPFEFLSYIKSYISFKRKK